MFIVNIFLRKQCVLIVERRNGIDVRNQIARNWRFSYSPSVGRALKLDLSQRWDYCRTIVCWKNNLIIGISLLWKILTSILLNDSNIILSLFSALLAENRENQGAA